MARQGPGTDLDLRRHGKRRRAHEGNRRAPPPPLPGEGDSHCQFPVMAWRAMRVVDAAQRLMPVDIIWGRCRAVRSQHDAAALPRWSLTRKRQRSGGCQAMTDTVRVIDSGYAVLDSPPADAGLAAPTAGPRAGDGSCGSEGGRPRHAEFLQNGRTEICGHPSCCSGQVLPVKGIAPPAQWGRGRLA